MASSGNFCTLNPIAQLGGSTDASTRAGSMSNGNLKYVNLSNNTAVGTFGVTSGKWYYEVYVSSFNADNGMAIGWANDLFNIDAELGYNSPSSPSGGQAFGLYSANQNLIYGPGDGGSSYNKSYGSGTPSDGDIMRIWLDADNGKFWAGLNGTIWGSGDPSAGTNWGFGTGGSPHNIAISSRTLYPAIGNWSAADGTVIFNFGQDSTFQGAVSAGGNADGNGFGDFKYDPDGFLALCSANVPVSDDIDPAQTDDDIPQKQFGVVTYTGSSTSAQTITGLGFKPDLVWAKMTNSSQRNFLTDTNRGITKHLFSDASSDEETDSGMGNTNPIYTAFNDDGFVFGTSGSGPNDSGREYVAWCWKGAGGVNASNAEGSTTCSTQANTKAGFSIITYTGTGSAATLGHGLEKAPEFIMAKRRSSPDQTWKNYHVGMGPTKYLTLNEADAAGTSSGMWNDTAPTNTLIHIGNESNVSTSSKDYIIYAWHGVEGYSKFGSYEGNGNNDGPFIYTGFRPRMIFFKWYETAASAEPWGVFDTVRATYNPTSAHSDSQVYWNTTAAASQGSTHGVDFLSNGVKLRGNGGLNNANGGQYIYGAWGDVPFKYNNTF